MDEKSDAAEADGAAGARSTAGASCSPASAPSAAAGAVGGTAAAANATDATEAADAAATAGAADDADAVEAESAGSTAATAGKAAAANATDAAGVADATDAADAAATAGAADTAIVAVEEQNCETASCHERASFDSNGKSSNVFATGAVGAILLGAKPTNESILEEAAVTEKTRTSSDDDLLAKPKRRVILFTGCQSLPDLNGEYVLLDEQAHIADHCCPTYRKDSVGYYCYFKKGRSTKDSGWFVSTEIDAHDVMAWHGDVHASNPPRHGWKVDKGVGTGFVEECDMWILSLDEDNEISESCTSEGVAGASAACTQQSGSETSHALLMTTESHAKRKHDKLSELRGDDETALQPKVQRPRLEVDTMIESKKRVPDELVTSTHQQGESTTALQEAEASTSQEIRKRSREEVAASEPSADWSTLLLALATVRCDKRDAVKNEDYEAAGSLKRQENTIAAEIEGVKRAMLLRGPGLEEVRRQKRAAVEVEDYEEASRLKCKELELLQLAGVEDELQSILKKKRAAVEAEDFEAAARLKECEEELQGNWKRWGMSCELEALTRAAASAPPGPISAELLTQLESLKSSMNSNASVGHQQR